MNSPGPVLLRTKIINTAAFNTQIAVRNILFVLALSVLYLSGKYYQAIHQSFYKPPVNSIATEKK